MVRSWIEAMRLSDRPTTALLGEEGFSAPTLVLTTFELDEFVYEALRAGASGFLVKRTEPAELIRAVHVVAAGEALLSPSVTRRLIAAFTSPSTGVVEPDARIAELLKARMREVVALVAAGLSNEERSPSVGW